MRKTALVFCLLGRLRGQEAAGCGDPASHTESDAATHCRTDQRQTCAKALRILEDEGLLTRIPGLGYYVTGKAAPAQPGS